MLFERKLNKKAISYISVALAIVCVVGIILFPTTKARAFDNNITSEDDSFTVFIGSSRTYSENLDATMREYAAERNEYVSDLRESKGGNEIASAVVVLNDYYSIDEVEKIASEYALTLDRAYLWMPGETGRLSLGIKDTKLSTVLNEYIKSNRDEKNQDKQMMKDLNRIASGEYGIFSITVTAEYENLVALHKEGKALLVDVIYDDIAENKAKQEGKTVKYIELPFKPDGAL
jgi:hypothetical protein